MVGLESLRFRVDLIRVGILVRVRSLYIGEHVLGEVCILFGISGS
jgi:hypothetical protein